MKKYGRKLMTNVFETRENNIEKKLKSNPKNSDKLFGNKKTCNTHSILETALASRTLH